MDIETAVTGLTTGVLTTPILYWLYPRIKVTDTQVKQLLTIAIAFGLGLIGIGLSILLDFQAVPTDIQGWMSLFVPVGTMAYTVSQVIFGAYESITV